MNKTKYITIRLDEDLYNRFKIIISTNLLNGAAVIRDLLQKYVSRTTLI